MRYLQIFEQFRAFEDAHNLFLQEIAGVRYWDFLRFSLFQEITVRSKVYEYRSVGKKKEQNTWRYLLRHYLNAGILRNPFFSGKREFCFFGAGMSRLHLRADKSLYDGYCDPLMDILGVDSCLLLEDLEKANCIHPRLHAAHVADSSLFQRLTKIMTKTGIGGTVIGQKDIQKIEVLEKDLKRIFGFPVRIAMNLQGMLARHIRLAGLYRRFLAVKRPKVVFLVCSYGAEPLVDACQQLRIPTVEIQHGTISPYQVGYSYPAIGLKKLFPDYLLTLGDYWKEAVPFPIARDRVMTLGGAFARTLSSAGKEKAKKILFLSQWTIGTALSRFAVALSECIDPVYTIQYKLHPNERIGWRKKYPWLQETAVEVVGTEDSSLDELQDRAEFQIGVYSTAIFEGLVKGCKTFVVDLPGVEHLQPLIDRGMVRLVCKPDEVDLTASFPDSLPDRNYFFSLNWKNNFQQFMEDSGWLKSSTSQPAGSVE